MCLEDEFYLKDSPLLSAIILLVKIFYSKRILNEIPFRY